MLHVVFLAAYLAACAPAYNISDTASGSSREISRADFSDKLEQAEVLRLSRDADPFLTEAMSAKCDAIGGNYQRVGRLGSYNCVLNYPDVGAQCSDKKDCFGQCRAKESGLDGEAVTGDCQGPVHPFGCYAEVLEGKRTATICVD